MPNYSLKYSRIGNLPTNGSDSFPRLLRVREEARNRVSLPVSGHSPPPPIDSSLHKHLLRPCRLGKIILGDLVIENGEWRIIKNTPTRMDFNSQFSILNSVSRWAFFQPIAVLAAARYCGAATTYSLLSPKISNASSRIGLSSGKIGQQRMPRPS